MDGRDKIQYIVLFKKLIKMQSIDTKRYDLLTYQITIRDIMCGVEIRQ